MTRPNQNLGESRRARYPKKLDDIIVKESRRRCKDIGIVLRDLVIDYFEMTGGKIRAPKDPVDPQVSERGAGS